MAMSNEPTNPTPEDNVPQPVTQQTDVPPSETPQLQAVETQAVETQAEQQAASDNSAGASTLAQRVAVGRKDASEAPSVNHRAKGLPIPLPPSGPVEVPSKRKDAGAHLDAEIEAALGGMSLDDIMSSQPEAPSVEIDQRYQAAVVRLHGDNVFFLIAGHSEGVASMRLFDEPPEIGTAMEIIVRGMTEGIYDVSIPGTTVAVADWDDVDEGVVVEATVTGANTGGLECTVNRLRGFIPASQVAMYRIEDFSDYIGKKLHCVVSEANPQRRNLVLSHRAVLEREREEGRQKLLTELEVGQVRDGIVRKLMDFGAFVDLGGIDGLIHISKLSWDRINHPSEVLTEGQSVQVSVDRIDEETGKISLSYRNESEHPWTDVEAQFPVNSTIKGTVTRIANFGAFVKLAPGVEGLIHVSELAHHRVTRVSNVVKEGEEVTVVILSVDPEEQRMSLSIKATLAKPENAAAEEEDLGPQESNVKDSHDGPLRGGTGGASGGDQFGLNW
ncbi:MAG: small subunit ribosomal protein S1 [Pirellulaceae bacterium]|jgi:small subunit ribosomal protein S1